MPPEIQAFHAAVDAVENWRTQGEAISYSPRTKFVQSSQVLDCPPPRDVPYDSTSHVYTITS